MQAIPEDAKAATESPTVPWFLASRRRLFGTLVFVLAAPMAGLGLLAAEQARRALRQQAFAQNTTTAELGARMVREHFDGLSRYIEVAARRQPLRVAAGAKDAAAAREPLRDLLARNPAFDRAVVVDASGVEWADYPPDPEAAGQDLSDKDWFRGVSRRGDTFVSDVQLRTGRPRILTVSIATPIRDSQRRTIGYLMVHHPIEAVGAWIAQVMPPSVGSVALIDGRGRPVRAARPGDLAPSRPGEEAVIRAVLSGRAGAEEADDKETGWRNLVSYAPVQPIGWGILVRRPVDVVFAPVEALRRTVWVLSLVCLAPMLVLGGLWLGSIRRFHQALRDRSDRLARAYGELRESHRDLESAHRDLQQAQSRMLQQAKMASLGQTAAGVAHEINNPLAYVTNNIAVLKREVAGLHDILRLYQQAEATLALYQVELLGRIRDLSEQVDLPYMLGNLDGLMDRSRDGLRRIQKIVSDLRDFAHLEEADRKEADLNVGIAAIVGLMRSLADTRQVSLEAHLVLIPHLTCYPAKLNMVVQNLISNAIDACRPGDRVVVRTRPADRGGVEIEVADTGCGIDPAIRDRIFDPFFTTKPIGQGTGLGLSMSYGIVKDHDGTIDLDSAPDRGTRFVVRLPGTPPGRLVAATDGLAATGDRG